MKSILPFLILSAIIVQVVAPNAATAQFKKVQPSLEHKQPASSIDLTADSVRAFLNRNKPYSAHDIPAIEVSRLELLDEIKMHSEDSIVIGLVRDSANEISFVIWRSTFINNLNKLKRSILFRSGTSIRQNELNQSVKAISINQKQTTIHADSLPVLYNAKLNAGEDKLMAIKFSKKDFIDMLTRSNDENVTILFSTYDKILYVHVITHVMQCFSSGTTQQCCPPGCKKDLIHIILQHLHNVKQQQTHINE